MKNSELLKSVVLFNCLNLQFLDWLDERINTNDENSNSLIRAFFDERKSFTFESVQETGFLYSRATQIGMMTPVILFLRLKNLPEREVDFHVDYFEHGKKTEIRTINHIIRLVRNVLAHNEENEETRIALDDEKVVFLGNHKNIATRVEFSDENFSRFVMWLIRNARDTMR